MSAPCYLPLNQGQLFVLPVSTVSTAGVSRGRASPLRIDKNGLVAALGGASEAGLRTQGRRGRAARASMIVHREQARIGASRQHLPCICQPIVEADGER